LAKEIVNLLNVIILSTTCTRDTDWILLKTYEQSISTGRIARLPFEAGNATLTNNVILASVKTEI